ncbi:hypothetical protein [Methylotuvimicrobium sp. KM2]|jgi:hypothetical protein|uniref:hypothetical protein n=1 Tax=Methylotuvimicrobium sp. KM2 TaxID=3133976 RepID=UPI003100B384
MRFDNQLSEYPGAVLFDKSQNIAHRGFDSRDEGVAPTKVSNALWERSPDRDFEAGRVR